MDVGRQPGGVTHLGLLPELRLLLSGTWSLLSVGVSEAEADDDWDDTDSLLPIDVSSAARLGASPAAHTGGGGGGESLTVFTWKHSEGKRTRSIWGLLMIVRLIKHMNNLSTRVQTARQQGNL